MSPCDVVANVLDGNIVESEFKHQSCYFVGFRTKNPEKGMTHLIHPAIGLIVPLQFKDELWHIITRQGWYAIKERNQTENKDFAESIEIAVWKKKA